MGPETGMAHDWGDDYDTGRGRMGGRERDEGSDYERSGQRGDFARGMRRGPRESMEPQRGHDWGDDYNTGGRRDYSWESDYDSNRRSATRRDYGPERDYDPGRRGEWRQGDAGWQRGASRGWEPAERGGRGAMGGRSRERGEANDRFGGEYSGSEDWGRFGGGHAVGSRHDDWRRTRPDMPQGDYDWAYSRPGRSGDDWSAAGPMSGRGPQGWRRADQNVCEDVNERLTEHGHIDASDIEVEVQECVVTLRGSVTDRRQKRLAEDVAESVRGVQDVRNELHVRRAGEQPGAGRAESGQTPSTSTMQGSGGKLGRSGEGS
jgi:hypothetical protein